MSSPDPASTTPDSGDRLLGEYRLKTLLSENTVIRRWLAEQVSVSRRVLVDELKPGPTAPREEFLADVRAKAAVDHPLIGSVFEAVAEPDCCFFAHELLPGASLEERREAGEPMKPARLAHVIRRVAEAELHQEGAGIATSPLGLEHIHLDDHGVIRVENLAEGGPRSIDHSFRDIARLGDKLRALVADGQPGATRMLTLLGWMRGEGLESHLGWEQVRDIALQIEQQLAEPVAPAPTKAAPKSGGKAPIALITGAAALIAVVGAIFALKSTPDPLDQPLTQKLPETVLIPAGRHPTADGTEHELKSFRIVPHEVTISQYATFLETLETLAKDKRERSFDHPDQPADKSSHIPEDWAQLLAAAKSNSLWKGQTVSLDAPVVGVDWWDGYAYAEWKRGRLASQEEWFAALRLDLPSPATLKPAGWIAVTSETTDRTPRGLVGMAGSVCEWTREPAPNPANPLGEPKWVLIGGSYLKPGTNALAREWVDDRSLRRKDLGFRIVFDAD